MKISLNYSLVVVFTAGFLAIATDIPLSWPSPELPKLHSNDTSINPLRRPITETEDAWLGSLMFLGAIIGPYPCGYIAEKFGRKIALLVAATPMTISFIILALARNIYVFYVARILSGFSVGASYAVLPLYVAEISENHDRGMLTQLLNIFWALGNCLSYSVAPFVSYWTFNIIIAVIPSLFIIIFPLVAPESPYFLARVNRLDKMSKSLKLLRRKDIMHEMKAIRDQIKNEENGNLLEIFKSNSLRKSFTISSVLLIAQELSGIGVVGFYLQTIFEASGSNLSSNTYSVISSVCIFLASLVSPFIVDKIGRRFLLLVSSFGLTIALGILGAYFYVKDHTAWNTTTISWIPLAILILYIFAYNFGISSVPWTVCSEVFPNNHRQGATTIISMLAWIVSFLVTNSFNTMNDATGMAGSFWMYSVFCFMTGVFCFFCVPETKGKSFNEIQDIIKSNRLFCYGFVKRKDESNKSNNKS